MAAVFISYCTADHFFAELAKLKLEAANIPVWVDRSSLRPGDDWRQEIDRGITDCFGVIIALSKDSAQSHYVTYEWASALGKNKPIVPILLSSCQRHPRLEPIQYLDFSNPSHQPWQQLIDWVVEVRDNAETSVLDEETQSSESPPEESTVVPRTKEDRAVEQILAYLNRRGFQMMSFERIRDKIDQDYNDTFLNGVISANPAVFRPARIKGGKHGLAKL